MLPLSAVCTRALPGVSCVLLRFFLTVLQMRKSRLREFKQLVLSHRATQKVEI